MPVLRSEAAQGANLSNCVETLSSLLENALTKGKADGDSLPGPHYSCLLPEPPLFAFSTALLRALLDDDSVISPNPGHLFSFINQHKDRIGLGLESISLKCLSIFLLRSSANDDCELALYLLMDEPEYITDSDPLGTPSKIHESGGLLQLAELSLVQKTYKIFTNETGDPRIRRMAGKAFVEIVYECPDRYCQWLEKLNREDLSPVILALGNPDYILMFFANIIIGVLHDLGVNVGLGWEPNGPISKSLLKMINHIQSKETAVKQFHSYVCEERENRVNICGGTRPDSNLPICYFIGLDEEHTKGPAQHPALLLFDANGIDLIQLRQDVFGLKIDYAKIRLSRHRTRTRCIFPNEHGGQKHLSLHIHADDIIVVNDRKKDQKIIHLSITARDDLARIRKGFEAIGIRCQTNIRTSRSSRRSSSIVIPLDTDDEACFASSRPFEAPSQIITDSTAHHARWRDESADPIDRRDYVVDKAPVDASQSSLTEFTHTPTFRGTSSPRVRESSHSQQNSPESSAKGQCMEKGRHIPDTATSSASREELEDLCPEIRQASEKPTPKNGKDFGEGGPARNTRSKSSQSEKSVCTNTVLNPIPPNTQESLIFPRRRSRGKLYTAPSKTMVDWDEDLRESDLFVEPEPRKDSELTSVSSALSSGTGCAFNKSIKPRSAPSVRRKPGTKTKRQVKTGRRRKDKRPVNKQAKLSSSFPNSVQNDTCPSDPHAFVLAVNNVGNNNRPCKERGAANDFSPAPRSASGKSHHSLSQEFDTNCGESTVETSFEDDRQCGWDNQGRGQTVAEKLIAALRGSSTPEKQFGDSENRPEVVHEPCEPLDEIVHGTLDANHKLRMVDMQDVPGSQASNMSRNGAAGDEIYSVEICSVDFPDGNRNSPLQDGEGDKGWILRARKSIFETESEQCIERALRISSLAASSSGEPRPRESSFEFYFTGSPPKPYCTLSDHSEKAASHDLFKQTSCVTEETSKTGITKAGDRDAFSATDALKELTQSGPDHVVKRLDSSSKTIVDNNGSPRLMQRGKNEHATPMRRKPPLVQQQPSAKRMKTTHRGLDRNVTLYEMGQNQSKNDDSPTRDSSPITTYTDTGNRSKRDTPGSLEWTIERSSKANNAVFATATGRSSSLEDLKPASLGLAKNGGQHESSEIREYSLRPPSITAGKLPLEGNNSGRQVAFQRSEETAGEIDRQTSLHELHSAMELRLIHNNEHLSRQIEIEETTVNKVLNTYKQQCHTVLDQLFDAQMERIRLCKQQMDSIKQQHANVCQGLIRRLEENERSLTAAAGNEGNSVHDQ